MNNQRFMVTEKDLRDFAEAVYDWNDNADTDEFAVLDDYVTAYLATLTPKPTPLIPSNVQFDTVVKILGLANQWDGTASGAGDVYVESVKLLRSVFLATDPRYLVTPEPSADVVERIREVIEKNVAGCLGDDDYGPDAIAPISVREIAPIIESEVERRIKERKDEV